jgi:hypothetical protein
LNHAIILFWIFFAGTLFGLFLIYGICSCLIIYVVVVGIFAARVQIKTNLVHLFTFATQAILFAGLAFGVYWLADKILDLHSLNAGTLSAIIGALISVLYGASRIEGKLVLARMCAFVPSFTEQIYSIPADQRIGFAKRSYLDNKTRT